MTKVMMYKRFERLWHWTQAFLILSLLTTGFEIHGTYSLFGFEQAVDLHIILAWSLIVLWVFAIFWHFTTGEWRQYIPASSSKLVAMVKYYGVDIFLGGGHPYHKTRKEKLNPMQRLAYLSLHVVISPAVWISGLLYLFYASWDFLGIGNLDLAVVALTHTAAAFAVLAFLVIHLYLAITTSKKPFGYVKAMITGYEDEE